MMIGDGCEINKALMFSRGRHVACGMWHVVYIYECSAINVC
jgi:hypothetical protein